MFRLSQTEPMNQLIRKMMCGAVVLKVDNPSNAAVAAVIRLSKPWKKKGSLGYRFEADLGEINTNKVLAAIRKGFIEQTAPGRFEITVTGRQFFVKNEGDFSHWEIEITRNLDEIQTVHDNEDELSKHLNWYWRAIPTSKKGVYLKDFCDWNSVHVHRSRRLFDALSNIENTFVKAGFAKEQISFPEISAEMMAAHYRQVEVLTVLDEQQKLEALKNKEQMKVDAAMSMDHILLTPVADVEMPLRAYEGLRKANIIHVCDLIQKTHADLKSIKNIGRLCIGDIEYGLRQLDKRLHLYTQLPEWQLEEIGRLKSQTSN